MKKRQEAKRRVEKLNELLRGHTLHPDLYGTLVASTETQRERERPTKLSPS